MFVSQMTREQRFVQALAEIDRLLVLAISFERAGAQRMAQAHFDKALAIEAQWSN